MAARLPRADVDRLNGQVPGLKLFPRHGGDLLAHLEAHRGSLASGAAIGPSALRRLLDVLAADHPAVQRMCCNGCGAQTRLPYRKDGASICDSCYRYAHLKVCVRCGQTGHPAFREGSGVVCTRWAEAAGAEGKEPDLGLLLNRHELTTAAEHAQHELWCVVRGKQRFVAHAYRERSRACLLD